MLTLHSPQVMQETALRWKRDSKVALIPTMGCIHEGHLKLVEMGKQYGQKTVVSLFVNPLQFGAGEDFENYPRPFEEDRSVLEAAGVDVLFAPSAKELYAPNFSTQVRVSGLNESLCGVSRPGHFEAVATVCLKLFQICQADYAVFGEKDFQQLRVIQQMVFDLNLALTVLPTPTVRESDGLALSSRNRYLSPEQRKIAQSIPLSLKAAVQASARLEHTVGDLRSLAERELARSHITAEYLTIASEVDLVPCRPETPIGSVAHPHIFIAARVGKTRLIDNAALCAREKGDWFHNEGTPK